MFKIIPYFVQHLKSAEMYQYSSYISRSPQKILHKWEVCYCWSLSFVNLTQTDFKATAKRDSWPAAQIAPEWKRLSESTFFSLSSLAGWPYLDVWPTSFCCSISGNFKAAKYQVKDDWNRGKMNGLERGLVASAIIDYAIKRNYILGLSMQFSCHSVCYWLQIES